MLFWHDRTIYLYGLSDTFESSVHHTLFFLLLFVMIEFESNTGMLRLIITYIHVFTHIPAHC